MSDRIRAGIVGTGFMGTVHARAVRRSGGVVSRVVGSTPASTAAAAERFDPAYATAGVEELIEADDVDVVHVCTPNATHAAIAAAALGAGKHVVCEKPLATSLALADDLTTAASGRVATVPFVYRFYPTVRAARARVADGTTGPVRLLHGHYLQDWMAQPDDENWRVDPELGGGSRAFADIGVHWCDLAEFVTGDRIARLCARTVIAEPVRGGHPVRTEDAATVLFETAGGVVGSLVVSQVSPGRKNRLALSVDAARESLAFDQEQPETLWIGGRDGNRELRRGEEGSPYSLVPPGHPQGYQDCFDAFVADTHAAIRGGAPDGLPTFADGRRAAALTEAVLASAAADSWIEVPR